MELTANPPGRPSRAATTRELARARTMAEIVRIGREHLAAHGAAALSLRAVARELGMVSSAVYRYVTSRDELLTLLLVEAYDELGDAVDQALAPLDHGEFTARFIALGTAVRSWALREPAGYGLLYGSPVPGYKAPTEQTTTPGTRVVIRLMQILDDAHRAGALIPAERTATTPSEPTKDSHLPLAVAADFASVRAEYGLSLDDEAFSRGLLSWTALFGTVNFEIFGQYGVDSFPAREELFLVQLSTLASLAGLPPLTG